MAPQLHSQLHMLYGVDRWAALPMSWPLVGHGRSSHTLYLHLRKWFGWAVRPRGVGGGGPLEQALLHYSGSVCSH